ncbi:MAG: hypothetical protein M3463_20695 [Verrucomicrobiota bacterium]|nr:hypothetical protein [Verrucomicrobiota bacterium]
MQGADVLYGAERVRIAERLLRGVEVAPRTEREIEHVVERLVERGDGVLAPIAKPANIAGHVLEGGAQRIRLHDERDLERMRLAGLELRFRCAGEGREHQWLRATLGVADAYPETALERVGHREWKLPRVRHHADRAARRFHEAAGHGAVIVGNEKALLRHAPAVPLNPPPARR